MREVWVLGLVLATITGEVQAQEAPAEGPDIPGVMVGAECAVHNPWVHPTTDDDLCFKVIKDDFELRYPEQALSHMMVRKLLEVNNYADEEIAGLRRLLNSQSLPENNTDFAEGKCKESNRWVNPTVSEKQCLNYVTLRLFHSQAFQSDPDMELWVIWKAGLPHRTVT